MASWSGFNASSPSIYAKVDLSTNSTFVVCINCRACLTPKVFHVTRFENGKLTCSYADIEIGVP